MAGNAESPVTGAPPRLDPYEYPSLDTSNKYPSLDTSNKQSNTLPDGALHNITHQSTP